MYGIGEMVGGFGMMWAGGLIWLLVLVTLILSLPADAPLHAWRPRGARGKRRTRRPADGRTGPAASPLNRLALETDHA
jgi:hypothetical protein